MDLGSIAADAASLGCGIAAILFTLIASASRSEKIEKIVQNCLFFLLIIDSILLMIVYWQGVAIWGSTYIARPLALLCVIIAISSKVNLTGKQISQGTNPHQIRKMRKMEQE